MHRTEERSIGDLFTELSHEISLLIRQEMALLRLEMTQKVSRLGKAAAYFALAGAIGYAAFLAFTAAAVFLLSELMPGWLAAFIVALVWGGAGFLLFQSARGLMKDADLTPHKTVDTLKEISGGEQNGHRYAA
jgi:hypothetical protein